MMTTATHRKSLPMTTLPQASIVIRGRMFPVEIYAAATQGGILQTEAKISEGSLVPLNLLSDKPATMTIHVLEVSEGKIVFRLFGTDTDGHARRLWEQVVRTLKTGKTRKARKTLKIHKTLKALNALKD